MSKSKRRRRAARRYARGLDKVDDASCTGPILLRADQELGGWETAYRRRRAYAPRTGEASHTDVREESERKGQV